jgi:RNA polymerase sigma-70 factor (ECF subfamily)
MSASGARKDVSLSAALHAHGDADGGPAVAAPSRLDDTLLSAQRAWPGITVDASVFLERLATAEARAASDECHTDDLYLACALEAHEPQAVAAFEALLRDVCPAALRRLDPTREFLDEVQQRLRQRLLMASNGSAPEIATYSGRGPLRRWLRSLALSNALMIRRSRRDELPLDSAAAWETSVAQDDPELDLVLRRYREQLRAALAHGLSRLTARQRTLLRLNLLCRLNIDEIGQVFGVHRATIARWLAEARGILLGTTRAELSRKLRVSRPELDSLLQKLRSRLQLSLEGLLDQAERAHGMP